MAGFLLLGGVRMVLMVACYAPTMKERLLENAGRKKIYELSKRAPGINLTEVQDRLGDPFSSLRYHAGLLASRGHVRAVRVRRALHLFPADTQHAEAIVLLMENRMLEFVKNVVKHPGTDLASASKRTGIHRKVLSDYSRRLVEKGLVHDHGSGKRHRLEATPKLAPLLKRAEEAVAAIADLSANGWEVADATKVPDEGSLER